MRAWSQGAARAPACLQVAVRVAQLRPEPTERRLLLESRPRQPEEAEPQAVDVEGEGRGRLDELLQAGPQTGPSDIGQHLHAPADAVARALRWLQAQSLITRAGH